jgi:hypothetical protein
MEAVEAKRQVDRITLAGRWMFGILSAATVILTVMKVGTDTDWAFVGDLRWPLRDVHWGDWLQIVGAIAAAVAASAAISFSFRYVKIKNVLNQLIEYNSTNIGSQDNSTHHHTTNTHGADPGVRDEVLRVGEHVRQLEQLLADKQANPEHLRQLQEFLQYAQNERILELKEQLGRDAELFERLRGLMNQLAAECENAGSQAQGVLLRRR